MGKKKDKKTKKVVFKGVKIIKSKKGRKRKKPISLV